jgi:aminopeptidase N
MQLNDDNLFFKILKDAQKRFTKSNITNKQFLLFFNEETKKDFTPFFDVYLKQTSPPISEFHIDKSEGDTATLEYRWAEPLPEDFKMKVAVYIGGEANYIYPSSNMQQLRFLKNQKYIFDISQFGYVLFKEIKK